MDVDSDDTSSLSSLSDTEDPFAPIRTTGNASKSQSVLEADNQNRRRSNRVSKPIQTIYKDAVEETATRKKRKRVVREQSSDAGEEERTVGKKNRKDAKVSDEEEEGDDADEENEEDGDQALSSFVEDESSEGEPDEEELKEIRMQLKKVAVADAKAAKGRKSAPAHGGSRRGHFAKPATKKVKTLDGPVPSRAARTYAVDSSSPEDERTPVQPRKRARRKQKKEPVSNRKAVVKAAEIRGDMFFKVFTENSDLDDIANDWLTRYLADKSKGMTELVNFIFKCCGSDAQLGSYDAEDKEAAAANLEEIEALFISQNRPDYPLVSKKAEYRKFRPRLSEFLESLVAAIVSQHVLANDPILMTHLPHFIATMTSRVIRAFRYTTTVIAVEMITHLAQQATDLRRMNGITNRQFEAERDKKTRNQAQVDSLATKLDKCKEKSDAVETLLEAIFNSFFPVRSRDVDPKIRIECSRGLGKWAVILPEIFYDSSYIRYLSWRIIDIHHAARAENTRALLKIFQKNYMNTRCFRVFMLKYKDILLSMASRDIDPIVRASSVELLNVARQAGFIEPEDITNIGRSLFETDQRVRKAVVPFFVSELNDRFNAKIEELGGLEAVTEMLNTGSLTGPGASLSWIKFKCLAEALLVYDNDGADGDQNQVTRSKGFNNVPVRIHEIVHRSSLVGAALWDAVDEVRDWESLTRFLLYDHSCNSLDVDDRAPVDPAAKVKRAFAVKGHADVVLIQILHSSVIGNLHRGPDPTRKPPKIRTAKEIERYNDSVHRNLINWLPMLLRKFGALPEAASTVLRITQLLKMDVYQELRQNAGYSRLLDEICRQIRTFSDESVLHEACTTLKIARQFVDLKEVTQEKVGHLLEDIINVMADIVGAKADVTTEEFEGNSLRWLVNTIKRLEALISVWNCCDVFEAPVETPGGEIIPVDVLISMLDRPINNDKFEMKLTCHMLQALDWYFMWKIESEESDRGTDVTRLIERAQRMMSRCKIILSERSHADSSKLAAMISILSLATTFRMSGSDRLESLFDMLEDNTQEDILQTFAALEAQFAKYSGRKLQPDDESPTDEVEEVDTVDVSVQYELENRLCDTAKQIVFGTVAGVMDIREVKPRLTRNKAHLGPNYKAIVAFLSDHTREAPGARRKLAKLATKKKKEKSAEEVDTDEEDPEGAHVEEGNEGEEGVDEGEEGVDEEEEGSKKGHERESEPHSDVAMDFAW